MLTLEGILTKVTPRKTPTGKDVFDVVIGGVEGSTFQSECQSDIGKNVCVEYVQKGKYKNIPRWTQVASAAGGTGGAAAPLDPTVERVVSAWQNTGRKSYGNDRDPRTMLISYGKDMALACIAHNEKLHYPNSEERQNQCTPAGIARLAAYFADELLKTYNELQPKLK